MWRGTKQACITMCCAHRWKGLLNFRRLSAKPIAVYSRYFFPAFFTSSLLSLPLQHHLSNYSPSCTLRKSPSQHHHPLLRLFRSAASKAMCTYPVRAVSAPVPLLFCLHASNDPHLRPCTQQGTGRPAHGDHHQLLAQYPSPYSARRPVQTTLAEHALHGARQVSRQAA